jgi:hypothetical protein
LRKTQQEERAVNQQKATANGEALQEVEARLAILETLKESIVQKLRKVSPMAPYLRDQHLQSRMDGDRAKQQ